VQAAGQGADRESIPGDGSIVEELGGKPPSLHRGVNGDDVWPVGQCRVRLLVSSRKPLPHTVWWGFGSCWALLTQRGRAPR
jgi:hypothetical protein